MDYWDEEVIFATLITEISIANSCRCLQNKIQRFDIQWIIIINVVPIAWMFDPRHRSFMIIIQHSNVKIKTSQIVCDQQHWQEKMHDIFDVSDFWAREIEPEWANELDIEIKKVEYSIR